MLLHAPATPYAALEDQAAPINRYAPLDLAIEQASNLSDATKLCQRLADILGASSFHLLFLATQADTHRLVPVFDSASPAVSETTKSFVARSADNFARSIGEATMPLWWSSTGPSGPLTGEAKQWADEIPAPTGSPQGVAFPVALERGRTGVIIFTGTRMNADDNRLCDVHARCFSVFEGVARQRSQERTKIPSISKRELECLRLTADGLTSEDIATSLGLSVHTANQYLTNSTHKLNAVNRIHAVAKALRSGLID